MIGCLVIVAVEQHEIALGDQRLQRNLVRGRGPIQDKVGALGAEDLRRLLLRAQRGTLMGQQVAKLEHRIVEIIAEH